MRRRGTNIVTRGSNFGRSRVIKSVGTTLGTILKGTENPGGLKDIGIHPRGNNAGRGARNIGRTTKRTR